MPLEPVLLASEQDVPVEAGRLAKVSSAGAGRALGVCAGMLHKYCGCRHMQRTVGPRSGVAVGMHLPPRMSTKAKLYIFVMAIAGLAALKTGLDPWESQNIVRLLCYLVISTVASGCKVTLPGVT